MVTARASSAMTHCIINQELAPKYITYSKVKTKQEKTRQKRVVWYLISSGARRFGQQRHESTHHQEKSEIGGLSVAFAGLHLPALPAFGLLCRLPRHHWRSIRVSFFPCYLIILCRMYLVMSWFANVWNWRNFEIFILIFFQYTKLRQPTGQRQLLENKKILHNTSKFDNSTHDEVLSTLGSLDPITNFESEFSFSIGPIRSCTGQNNLIG